MRLCSVKHVYIVCASITLVWLIMRILNFHARSLRLQKTHSNPFRFRKSILSDNTNFKIAFPARCDTTIAIILCNGTDSSNISGAANDFYRQMNQTIVMLKSIAISARYSNRSNGCIKVIVIADSRAHFERLKTEIFVVQNWDVEFTKHFRFSYVSVKYPAGFDWMRSLFRPCATMRLFLPDLLHRDAVLYLDTDIIFLRDVRDLWLEQSKFSNETLGAMAPCLFHYGSKKNAVPYYGSSGLNAGIMLMNLTRMKRTLWTRKIHLVTAMFQHQIKLADQDILNIYFHYYPEEMYLLSCDWNFRPFQCRKGSHCKDAQLSTGISTLHGNSLSFTENGPEPLFRSIFQTFQNAQLNADFRIHKFIEDLSESLQKVEDEVSSDCAKYGGLNAMIANRLAQISEQ